MINVSKILINACWTKLILISVRFKDNIENNLSVFCRPSIEPVLLASVESVCMVQVCKTQIS